MEKSFYCTEQIYQMQSTYDAFVLCKIAYDAGADILSDPIEFYCDHWGEQHDVFWECMKRIFGEIEHIYDGLNDDHGSMNTYKIPLPELKSFYLLLRTEEKDEYVRKFNAMLTWSDDCSFDFEMNGEMSEECFYITFNGDYGTYSTYLERIVEIRNEVRTVICERKTQMIDRLRKVVLLKMVYDRLGVIVESSMEDQLNVVFYRIMASLSIAIEPGDPLSYDSLLSMLSKVIDQVVIDNQNRGEVAA